MAENPSDFHEFRTKLTKSYLQEAFSLCLPCLEPKPDIGCSANCSAFYEDFLYGKSFVEGKFGDCLKICEKSSKKCKENCHEAAVKDLRSLDELLRKSL